MDELNDFIDKMDKAADNLLFNILTKTTTKVAPAEQTEPLIIEGRPFTPDDLQHLDELNEEMLKQNPPKPFQWKKGMLSYREWEEMCLQRPIIPDTPTEQNH